MNRLLILLFMVGWALWIVQVNSGGTGEAVRSEQNAKVSGQATPGQQAAALSELQPTAPATVHSPHAIAPDEAPPKPAVSSGASPPQTHPAENPEPQPKSSPFTGEISVGPDLLKQVIASEATVGTSR
jgi:hypothetical protein